MDPAQEYIERLAQTHQERVAGTGGVSLVRQSYEGRTVFVTGGNGFLGKQLLEKLFRSCHIEKAYLLLRPKKGKSVQERLEILLEDSVYDELRKVQPDFSNKIIVIEGDVKELKLGIKNGDWEILVEETEVIFHGAATINFEEHLKIAALTNVRGTREIISFARECKKLRALVHLSTAYSQATRDRIGKEVLEEVYRNPVTPELLIQIAEAVQEDVLDNITPVLIKNWPNTYTFTKAVAEHIVKEASDVPAAIIRPAIVINSYREPVPGWVDESTVFGPSGLVFGGGLGVVHVLKASEKARIDMLPVDYVNNAIVVAGHEAMEQRGTKIYNMATTRNAVDWGEKHEILKKHIVGGFMTPKAVWYYFIISADNKYLYNILAWLWHYIPAYLVDVILRLCGKPAQFVKIHTKAAKLLNVLSYFTLNNWKFCDRNTHNLFTSLSECDKNLFTFDIAEVNWQEQITLWGLSVRKYIIKDGLVNSEYGRSKQCWLKILHYVVSGLYFYMFWVIFCMILAVFKLFLSFFVEL